MKSKKSERIGWYFYDWANSVFYTTVVTVFLGPYLTAITKAAANQSGFVYPLHIPVNAGSFFPYVISLSVIFQFFFLPFAGAIADYTHRKKFLLGLFAYIGAISSMGLYFLNGTNYMFGGVLFIIANFSFGVSVVMYNAYLNDIAEPDRRDAVSSIGWAFGYLGGGILLGLNLLLVLNAKSLNISTTDAIRICLLSAGLWWALFTIVPLITLKVRKPAKNIDKGGNIVKTGINELFNTIKDAKRYPKTIIFLVAYLLYNDGVQSVITLAAVFGQEELKLSIATLTITILMVQFIAFFGSLIFNNVAKILGTKNAIILSLFIWTGAIIYAFGLLKDKAGFFVLSVVIATVLGATQALSRSLYSLLIPEGKEAEYFSLYEVSDKGTSWLGPLFFGLALQFTGSYRIAILSLICFFIAGIILLFRLNLSGITENFSVDEKV